MALTGSVTNVKDIDWLYPDLLSKDGLIFILKQRHIQHGGDSLDSLEKEELVELYNRYILPLPQRKYRNNRRGREMTKKQIVFAKKRKLTLEDDEDEEGESHSARKKLMQSGPTKGLVNSFGSPVSRLKPPPSCINFEKKIVKLGSSKVTKTLAAPASEAAEIKTIIKLKKLSVSSSSDKNTSKVPSMSISNSGDSKETGSESKDNTCEETNNTVKKKKFATITWP